MQRACTLSSRRPLPLCLGLVKDLGCRKYSIGSDGHKLEHFRLNFDKIQELLREFDITDDMII